jgi:hypothetical protein
LAAPEHLPDLGLTALDGSRQALLPRKGRTLLCIGHGDCATSRLLLPYLDRIHVRTRSVEVVAILQDARADARALVSELGLRVPVLLDEEPWPLGAALGLESVPLTLLVEGDGSVLESWSAFRRDDVEEMARRAGLGDSVFTAAEQPPALRPG